MGSQRVGQDLAIQLAGMVEEEDKISLDVRKVSRLLIYDTWTSLVVQMVMNLPAMQETQARSLGQEDPLEKRKAIHSVFLPGEFHGERNLAGYSPCRCKESDRTDRLTHTF